MNWNPGALKDCRLPFVITWATPRPAMNRISVATMGWMRYRVTSQPLNQPSAPVARIGSAKASATPANGSGNGNSLPKKMSGASVPAIAISAPTDRSIPPVAITSVMPTPTITVAHTCVRLMLSVCQLAKLGVTSRLNGTRASSASSAP